MRRLIVAICVVAVLWSAWWVVASRFALVAVRQAVAVLGQNELRVSLGDVGVTGFPNRLDLILQDLAVVDAGTGRALRLPKLDLYTLTWNPWHVLFALPGGLSLTGAADTSPLTLMPQTFLASVQVPPFGDMSLSAAQMQADGVVIDHMGAQGHVGHLFAASRQRGDARSHDLWFELKDVTLPEGWVPPASGAQTGTGAALAGNVISGAHLDAAVDFAAPVTLTGPGLPDVLAVTLRDAVLDWGPIHATARGTISPDANGLAEGRLDLTLTGWQALAPTLQAAGIILPQAADGLTRGLAAVSGPDGVAHLPLTLSGGMVRLGFVPLGPAPRLSP